MRFPSIRAAALCTLPLAIFASPAAAEAHTDTNVDPDRDYLPSDILVTGQRERYGTADGSTATKTATPLIDVPQAVAVITEDQLNDQAITQLGEALRYIPGVSLESGEGHRDEVFIRGQETTADFYLDGLRDDAQYYRSLYNVERIEVLKGANALIFGRGGGGGVVNRVSKTASLGGQEVAGLAQVDSFGAFALTGDVNMPAGENVAVRVTGTYEEFDSNRDYFEGRFIGITPTVTAELGPDTRVTAHYTYDDDQRVTDRGVPSFEGGPLRGYEDTFFGIPGFNEASSEVHIARARIEHQFSGSLRANASVQYANYDKVYANVLPTGTDGETVTLGGYQDYTDRENLIGQANLIGDFATGALTHKVLVGIEASQQDTQNGRFGVVLGDNTVDLDDPYDFTSVSLTPIQRQRDSDLNVLSAYVQDQISLGSAIDVIAGVRWDRFDLETLDVRDDIRTARVDEMFSPRFGIVVKPMRGLSLYASYSQSFLPQAGDQFVLLSPEDAAFEPEKFDNYEIGAKWLVKPDLFLTAAIFRLDRTNTQAANPDNSGTTVLVGESRVEGFELSLTGAILPNWEANIAYTYLDGEITTSSVFADAGTRLQQLPENQFAAWNHFDVTERLGFGLGAIYQDEQFSSFSNEVVLPDYWRVDLAAYYEVTEGVQAQLNIENLFDEDYFPSAHGDNNIQPAKPFSVRAGIRFEL
ncbi:TonB-dependent receptor [Qipengyuania atrilutea]|uniref:TonB-dependent siderophore receptor n=1 Tax=Qipengyuania atrilutea TaxID=2744473 RepID=A0A850GZA2_9SPHN|nr:TonB-dependent siderophore receptor [Actirhodobacter atriluteus]NVD44951.1 TonB-dependent siderophore receptor [Actirhodobacter atriluteus]